MSQTPSTRPLVIMRYHCIFVLSVLTTGLLGSFAKHLSQPWDDMHTKHSWNTIPKNWETLGRPPSGTTIDLYITLRPQRENAVIDVLHEVSEPRHPKYRAYLTKEQVADLVAPRPETLDLFSEKFLREWTPEPPGAPLTAEEQSDLASVSVVSGANGPWPKLANPGKHVLNLASYNFTGLAGNETIKVRAIETLWKYGVGSGGTPRFYVLSADVVHTNLERDIADFLGTEASILYSQAFSAIPCVVSAFAMRGKSSSLPPGVSILLSRGACKFLVLRFDGSITTTRRAPETRFIVTEGIFEKDSAMVDFPKLIELKDKYMYRLILDESISFGTVGRTGRGLTELYNVPATQIDMITRSVATGLNSSGGFCAGSRIIVDHQHINSTSFVFSAAVPALLAASASEGINILRNTPLILSKLQENPPNPATPALRDAPSFDIAGEERLLQGIVNEALAQGVWTTQARRLRGKELVEACPSIRLAVTAALSHKGCERAAGVIKAAVVKVLTRRK
ncbi:pyridoxal phosphate-dependent transferase [Lactarius hatsudake]|nr:pyridoxal phosphate-dependent transferase [Lactarius hatsudake]